jgi:CRISPR-associated protein Cas1
MEHEQVAETPAYVPARMVNEFVYCPRFFHLAWSSGERGENDFTAEGKWQHRHVDRPTGAVEPESSDGRATSVLVSSDRLRVIANVDIIETRDGTAIPVELKRGRPKDADHPVWEPERIQIAVAAMVLRDNGYEVPYAEVRFTDSTERARIELTDHLLSRTNEVLDHLWHVAADPLPPPPLVASPKCPACVMNAACLPDEFHMLAHGSKPPARRLVPSDSQAAPMYVTQPGARVGIDGQQLVIKREREVVATARLIDVSQVALFGNVQVSTQAMRELFARETPVVFFSGNGWFQGIATGLPGKNVELRRRQVLAEENSCLAVARAMVEGKVLNARVLLRRNSNADVGDVISEMKRQARFCRTADSMPRLLGIEGGAARLYFSRFATMLKGHGADRFGFDKRTRRPPADPVNCVLSYVYSLLVKDCTVTLLSVGFDPYVGVYHRPRFGRPALALDLAEEFRPLIADSTLLTVINNGEVNARSFTERAGSVGLTPEGRRAVLTAYERRLSTEVTHPTFGYKVTYRRVIEVQARILAAALLGELDSYRPMVTR